LGQGDQIGRTFAHRVVVYDGQHFENCLSSLSILATICRSKMLCISFDEKTAWAAFWAIFYKLIWSPRDRCYDFKNIFAENFCEKMAFLTQNKAKF
jgi:hypothetical protein